MVLNESRVSPRLGARCSEDLKSGNKHETFPECSASGLAESGLAYAALLSYSHM